MSLINETSYKEESEIDYFASVTFPSIACAYISQHRISPPYKKDKAEWEYHFEKAIDRALQNLEI